MVTWYRCVFSGSFLLLVVGSLFVSNAFASKPGQDKAEIFAENDPTPIAKLIGTELASDDPETQKEGAADLQQFALDGPLGGGGPIDRSWRCRTYLEANWFDSLVKLQHFDLLIAIAKNGLSNPKNEVHGTDCSQYCLTRGLLAIGKNEEALAAAKQYYNFCELEHTARAINLVAEALANAQSVNDHGVVRRFRMQQAWGAQPRGADLIPTTQPAYLGENILHQIKVSGVQYQASIIRLKASSKSFNNLTTLGDLLLLADNPVDARACFEGALDISNSANEATTAVIGITRSIRAIDGNVGGANAYILSLRQGGL